MRDEFTLHHGSLLMLKDLQIDATKLLQHAQLPMALLAQERASLTTEEYFRLWRSLEALSPLPNLPLAIGQALCAEYLDPPVFAALCSPNLSVALQRIQLYKRLVMPLALEIEESPEKTMLSFEWTATKEPPPRVLVNSKLVFFVQLARLATRHQVCPLFVGTPKPVREPEAYQNFFGVPTGQSALPSIIFDGSDMTRPFLTENLPLWKSLEPDFKERLKQLDTSTSTQEKADLLLRKLLPSGRASVEEVSAALKMSKRTFQRKLADENTTYQIVLEQTRKCLAKQYLAQTGLTATEVGFLLGYEKPSSFFRAFKRWTGQSPKSFADKASLSP